MDRTNPKLIKAIRKTIDKLKKGAHYQWGHMGACNCGNLAQEIVHLTKADIHQFAMQRAGDWNEQLNNYCPTSGYPMDLMISRLVDAGLTLEELGHLERLSDPKVLSHIPLSKRNNLLKNNKEDLIYYLETLAKILESAWTGSTHLKNTFDRTENFKKNIPSELLA